MRSLSTNISLLPLALTFLVLFSLNLTLSSALCNPSDKKALLQLQTYFSQSYQDSWDPKLDCCKDWRWPTAVKCNANGRVTELYFQAINTANGQMPSAIGYLPYLTNLTWWGSDLAGPLPLSFSMLTNLKTLDLHINSLNGSLDSLTNLKSLVYADLSNNQFGGAIPFSLTKLQKLQSISLTNNKITGQLPVFLSRMKSLTELDFAGCQLSGPIPASLANLPNLVHLRLTQNKYSGSIPASLGYFQNPRLVLDLASNGFSGPIPKSLGLLNITGLSIANNGKLTGDASFLFGRNKIFLNSIDISFNRFSFDFSNVDLPPGLKVLDINNNKIYGSLPKRLGQLPLSSIDVSNNKLCGPIPTGRRLKQFSADNFADNKCLCGLPLPPCKS